MARKALIFLLAFGVAAIARAQIVLPLDSVTGKIVYDTLLVTDNWQGSDSLLENYFRENYANAVYKSPKTKADTMVFSMYGWRDFSYAKKIGSKSRCWMRVEGKAVKDSLHISITNIAHQDFPDSETRDPNKNRLEVVYEKYMNKWSKKHQPTSFDPFLIHVDNEMRKILEELSALFEMSSE